MKTRLGFTRNDLALFGIEEDLDRKQRVREEFEPRLQVIAEKVLAPLSRIVGQKLSLDFSEGKQSSRPGGEVSVVFSGDSGKPAFWLGLSRAGVHARLVVQGDAPGRKELAKKLSKAAVALSKELEGFEIRRYDDWDHRLLPRPNVSAGPRFWRELAEDLARDSGSLDVGVGWPESRATALSYADLIPAFRRLMPLFRVVSEPKAKVKGVA